VWRTALRLGVPHDLLEDVLQDVYLTIFRKLDQFEGRCAAKTWALAITIRVASNYRRTRQRKGAGHALTSFVVDPEIVADSAPDPHEQLARAEAIRAVNELIAGMDERRATVFTLVELGGQRVCEIAKELGTNVNTTQARLRAARRDFERGVQRRRSRERCE
jgi:RNA polymerase sigma-70 factor (ECF subfamily)